jgi:hypothetical protein
MLFKDGLPSFLKAIILHITVSSLPTVISSTRRIHKYLEAESNKQYNCTGWSPEKPTSIQLLQCRDHEEIREELNCYHSGKQSHRVFKYSNSSDYKRKDVNSVQGIRSSLNSYEKEDSKLTIPTVEYEDSENELNFLSPYDKSPIQKHNRKKSTHVTSRALTDLSKLCWTQGRTLPGTQHQA